jgi:putative ABC transport system ATP-binding protein
MGRTIVRVTHDPAAASWADRAVSLADGQIVGALPKPTAETVLAQMHKLDTRIMASQARDDR